VDKQQLKQRIVGAIVLVALGVIFIPMILNREENPMGITGSNIPIKPQQLEQLAGQTPPALPATPATPAETRQVVDKDTPPLPEATPELVQQEAAKTGSPPANGHEAKPTATPADTHKTRGWVVQIASFTDRSKALQLRDRLLKGKFNCFVESLTGKHGTLYRVRVGPVIKREEADQLQTRIAKKFRLKGTLVMSYP